MSKMKIILACAAISLGAACTTSAYNSEVAQTEAPIESSVEAPADDSAVQDAQVASLEEDAVDDDRVICKRTIVTGSRFKKKVCKTWAEWKLLEEQAQQGLGRSQQLGTTGTPDALGR